MSYANPPQDYPPSSDRWPPAGGQGGGQPPAYPGGQQPPYGGQPQYGGQQPGWAPEPRPLPTRPGWEPPAQQALPTGEGWQPSHHASPAESRHQPPPVQRSGSGAKWAIAVAAVAVLGVLAYFFWPSSGSGFDVKVTKCQSTGSVASVGLSVHNNGSSTQTATIRVEYDDKSGKLIDSDIVQVHDIGSGDTKLVEQSTILDVDESMTCHVTAAA
jgi:hypothetical protein